MNNHNILEIYNCNDVKIIENLNSYSIITSRKPIVKTQNTHHTSAIINQQKVTIDKQSNISLSYIWILYVLIYGYEEFKLISPIENFKTEQSFRYKIIEILRKTGESHIKELGYKTDTYNSELGNGMNLSLITFLLCISVLKINIFIKKGSCGKLMLADDIVENIQCVDINNLSLYSEHMSINDIKNTHYLVDNIIKPMSAITSYKLKDLQEISSQMGITINYTNESSKSKNKTKKQLYEEVIYKIEI